MRLTIHELWCPYCKAAFQVDLPTPPNPHDHVETTCAKCSRYSPKKYLRPVEIDAEDTPTLVARKRSHYKHQRHGISFER